MMKKDTESDNWGQILSDLGIADNVQEEEETVEPVETVIETVTETVAEVAEQPPEPKEKKSIFSRFPKVSFFGAPPDVSLDSVIEEVKSPSLSGKGFTDNKRETMPLSKEWADRQERSITAAPDPDVLSAVASQIDALASRERPAKRQVSSMFDDPIPESEEFRALKGIMGEPPRREEPQREGSRRDTFREEETDSWQRGGRGRGRAPQKPQPQEREKEVRGRGSRYRPPVEERDLSATDFETIDGEMPRTHETRERGRRGSRYAGESYQERGREREQIQDDAPQEEWSEVDAALQAGRGESVQRGGRRQRFDQRRGPERAERQERPVFDREPADMEASGVAVSHWNVPNWDEAVGDIVAANIVRHKSYSGKGRR